MKRVVALVFAASALLALTACEEDVITPRTERPFTLYGFLSPDSSKQALYVFPIEKRLRPLPATPLDAQVTTIDLVTGETVVWRDSVVTAAEGGFAHLFQAPLRAAYGHAYLLEAERSDGAKAMAEIAVPERATLTAGPTFIDARGRPATEVTVDQAAPKLLGIEVIYRIQTGPADEQQVDVALDVEYAEAARATESGWTIAVNHEADYTYLRNRLGRRFNLDYGIYVHDVRLALLVVSAAWNPPGGSFDPEVLIQPEVMTNVENGYGFVGAGYQQEVMWMPPAEVLAETGFRANP